MLIGKMNRIKILYQALYNRCTLKANCDGIGIGLIGIGGWGITNAENIMRSRRFNVNGVYDIHTESACKFADRFKTKFYRSIDELLDAREIHAVCISVPNHFHAGIIVAAADAQKHVFIEKPLASDPDICRALSRYCAEKHVILTVGHQMRREPVIREIKQIIAHGTLGLPLFAQGVYTLDRRLRDDWRCDASACPGGSMEQLGVHLIDVLIYLFGYPTEASGWAENIARHLKVPDWGNVSLSFNNGMHATISTSFSSPAHFRMEIFFDNGHLATDGKILWITRGTIKTKVIKPKGICGGVAQFIEFADCIEGGNEPQTGGAVAAIVMDVVSSIICRTGR